MKRLTALAITVLFLAGCGAGLNWEPYASQEGNFTVLMPGEVQTQTTPSSTPAGMVTNKIFLATTDDAAFIVSYTDLPKGVPFDAQRGLEGGVEGTTKGYTDVNFKYEKDIEIDGNPGKEFRFTGKQSGTHIEYVSRVYIARDRIYQISITGMKGKIAEKTIKTFFNSFELI